MKRIQNRVRILSCASMAGVVGFLATQVPEAHAAPALAGYVTYAVFQGVRGTATYAPGSFDVLGMSYGVSNSGNVATSTKGVGASRVTLEPISFEKKVDAVTPALVADLTLGRQVSGSFYERANLGDQKVVLVEVDFTGEIVSDQGSLSAQDPETEYIAIQPTLETISVTPVLPDGTIGKKITVTYDARINKTTLQ